MEGTEFTDVTPQKAQLIVFGVSMVELFSSADQGQGTPLVACTSPRARLCVCVFVCLYVSRA